MFGYRIIKDRDYKNLLHDLTNSQVMLSERNAKISSLEFEIVHLNNMILELKKKEVKKEKKEKVILLTDIAETPLEVAEEPEKDLKTKKRRTTKKEKDKVVTK